MKTNPVCRGNGVGFGAAIEGFGLGFCFEVRAFALYLEGVRYAS